MLLLMMELKGRFNSKMIKKAKFGDVYFDDMGGFESIERDRVLGTVSRIYPLGKLKIDPTVFRTSCGKFTSRSLRAIFVLASCRRRQSK